MTDLARENRLRRILRKRGYRLMKSPARSALRRYQPVGYALLRLDANAHIMGDRFDASLDDVERFVNR